MASSQTKTAVIVSVVILLIAGITVVLFEASVLARQKAERAKDFVAYEVQHSPPVQSESDLRNQMVGTWELAADKSWGAAQYSYYSQNHTRLKIFTQTNWTVLDYDSNSNIVTSAGGPYTLETNLYMENIQWATGGMTQFLGAHPHFKIRVEGDKYYQMGLHLRPPIEEMWQRVPQ